MKTFLTRKSGTKKTTTALPLYRKDYSRAPSSKPPFAASATGECLIFVVEILFSFS